MSRCGWCEDAPWRVECALCAPRRRLRLCAACAARWHARGAAQEHAVADVTGVKRPYRDWARDVVEDGQASAETQRAGGEAAPAVGSGSRSDARLDLASSTTPLSSSRSKAAALDALVRRFPTEDEDAHAALAALTLRAVAEQDALLCAYFNKCEKPECVRALAVHKRHKEAKSGSDAGDDDETQWALAYCIHLDECISTTCPFCIRGELGLRLRVNVGSAHSMDRLLVGLRREIVHVANGASADASASDAAERRAAVESCRNRLMLQIAKVEKRRQQHVFMSRKLDQLDAQHVLHEFSFPPFLWHFGRGASPEHALSMDVSATPASLASSRVEGSTSVDDDTIGAHQSATDVVDFEALDATTHLAAEVIDSEAFASVGDGAGDEPSASAESAATSDAAQPEEVSIDTEFEDPQSRDGDPVYASDVIDKLLAAKQAAPRDASARDALEKALALGCAIVDAGMCSPARASRCLLGCQTILMHLQHHVDLDVCSDEMCDAVEHHFAHLSQCPSRSGDVTCEYCVRVRERELARSVEALEMEQPEADARVQSVINAMTDSLTDDPPAEREQAIMQLEDELEQAEEDKRRIAESLSAERLELRRVRRQLDRERFLPPAGTAPRLPPHFIKVLK